MEKYKKLLAILICIAIIVSFVPKNKVHADGMTAAMLGSVAYSIMSASGISFTAGNATASGMGSFMTGQIESYVNSHGGSLTSLFGAEMARLAVGKLVVGQQMYNGVLNFVDWLKDKYTLSSEDSALTDGTYQGISMPVETDKTEVTSDGLSAKYTDYVGAKHPGYRRVEVYLNGNYATAFSSGNSTLFIGPVSMRLDGRIVVVDIVAREANVGREEIQSKNIATNYSALDSLSWSVPENWLEPAPLPQDKQWEGDFSGTPGFAEPPTDLPDFLSRIPVAVADNQLVVAEEIADTGGNPPPSPTPSPTPSPRPTPAPVPEITIAQKIAAILGEIMGLIGLAGDTPLTQEQQQQIADTAQNIEDSVKDVTQNITDTITQQTTETSYNIQEQTQTLTDGQQQIKDAIQDQTQTLTDTLPDIKDAIQDQTQTLTDTLPDIKDAIQDQTQDITDIKDAIEDATQVPTDFEPQKHPLPRGVFPFCIPFDLHDIIVALDAAPVTPEVHIPFRVPTIMGMNFGLDYTFDLDLHDFDGLAQVLRTLEFIAFGVGLLFVTGKVIKW